MADRHRTHRPTRGTTVLASLLLSASVFCSPALVHAQEARDVPDVTERPAVLSGHVVSAVDEIPLANAQVQLMPEGILTATDERGRFHFSAVVPGDLRIVVAYLGTAADPAALTLHPGELHRVRITMDVAVEPIRAEIPRSELPGKLRGFYQRMDSEQGYFITRSEIEERDPRRMTDMLRRIPGVEVGRGGIGNVGVRMGRGRACAIQYFVDGARAPFFEIDNLAPGDVAGLEIYPGVARVPVQFRDRATCGAIVIWTRDPASP